MDKIDVYRLYRILSSVRKSLHLQSSDQVMKLKHDAYIRDFLRNLMELQDLSNTFLELFLFSTSILVAILQLFQSLFSSLPTTPTGILLVFYFLFILVSWISYARNRRKLSKTLIERENKIVSEITELENQIYMAGIKDEITTSLSELKLMMEIRDEYDTLYKTRKVTKEEFEYETESIEEAYKGVEERVLRLKNELQTKVKIGE